MITQLRVAARLPEFYLDLLGKGQTLNRGSTEGRILAAEELAMNEENQKRDGAM
jgi:hypothetical protein